MDLRNRYPARAFLLQKERRFLVRRADGSFDPNAIRMSHRLLDTYTSIDVTKRARLQKSLARLMCVGDAVRKGAWSFADLDVAGNLHTGFGFPIVIEVPDGGTRTGTSKDGSQWSRVLDGMSYGFLPDTIAADAEELDAIVGKDINAPMAFVMDQGDEIKVAFGYATAQDARDVYEKNWPPNMLKAVYEVPMALVHALLCAEPAALSNALHSATNATSVIVMNAGETIGTITKSASIGATMLRQAYEIRKTCMNRAFAVVKQYRNEGAIPLTTIPELAGHPALTEPLTETYENPAAVDGWLGWIEPSGGAWIAFVDVDGHGLLWTNRESDGGVIGAPFSFERPDLATKVAPTSSGMIERERLRAMFKSFQRPVDLLPVEKSIGEDKPLTVFSVVLEPEPNDGAGDLHRETYGEDFVRQTAHDYTMWFMNLDDQHGEFLAPTKAAVCESYLTKQPEMWGPRTVKKGSWIMGIKIFDPELKRQVLAGEKTGLSIEGFAERVPNTQIAAPLPEHRAPEP